MPSPIVRPLAHRGYEIEKQPAGFVIRHRMTQSPLLWLLAAVFGVLPLFLLRYYGIRPEGALLFVALGGAFAAAAFAFRAGLFEIRPGEIRFRGQRHAWTGITGIFIKAPFRQAVVADRFDLNGGFGIRIIPPVSTAPPVPAINRGLRLQIPLRAHAHTIGVIADGKRIILARRVPAAFSHLLFRELLEIASYCAPARYPGSRKAV